MLSGILNVYKEKGYTSHDVVAKLRGILKQKKIGHTGTLDPEAEGVLPVCLGRGTKLCGMLTDKRKTYQAVLRLGIDTDTQDMTGEVISRCPVEATTEEVENCIRSFVGNQMQIPPMYSALKVGGKKLYELAREGKEVERKPRPVTFYEIKILSMELPLVTMEVTCSKGTYIRTLCHDIGEKLGCGGCMESLLRTRVDQFLIRDSLKLSQIQELAAKGCLEEYILVPDQMFPDCPKIKADRKFDKMLENGNPLPWRGAVPGDRIRLYHSSGVFIGIYQWQKERKLYKPEAIFSSSEDFLPARKDPLKSPGDSTRAAQSLQKAGKEQI